MSIQVKNYYILIISEKRTEFEAFVLVIVKYRVLSTVRIQNTNLSECEFLVEILPAFWRRLF